MQTCVENREECEYFMWTEGFDSEYPQCLAERNYCEHQEGVGVAIVSDIWLFKKQYLELIEHYKSLNHSKPEYRAREPKIKAYKLLILSGFEPKDAVEYFDKVVVDLCPTPYHLRK